MAPDCCRKPATKGRRLLCAASSLRSGFLAPAAILAGAVFWRRSSCYGGRRPSGCCLLHGMQHRAASSIQAVVAAGPDARPSCSYRRRSCRAIYGCWCRAWLAASGVSTTLASAPAGALFWRRRSCHRLCAASERRRNAGALKGNSCSPAGSDRSEIVGGFTRVTCSTGHAGVSANSQLTLRGGSLNEAGQCCGEHRYWRSLS